MNRRAILEHLTKERNRAQRDRRSLGVILIDIDKFKSINDNYGHPVGDDVLIETSRRLTQAVRSYDSVGRLGGEEFLLVLPNATIEIVAIVAERIRRHVAAMVLDRRDGVTLTISISLGVTATERRDAGCIGNEKMIEEADEALYRAKQQGRNRVEIANID